MQRSYKTDHSFYALIFPVQNIRVRQFTCWSKVQSPCLKSANVGRSVCSGRSSSSSKRRKRKSTKSRRLRFRCLNRDSNSTKSKTRVVVRLKCRLASQISLATPKTWTICAARMCSKSLRLILMKTRVINWWLKTRTPTKTLLPRWSDPNATKAGLLSDVHTGEQCASVLFWCSVPLRSFLWYQHVFLVCSDCFNIVNTLNVKISLLIIRQIKWPSFISKHKQ